MTTIAKALEVAAKHHHGNRLTQAGRVYRQILSQQPHQPNALWGLGTLAQQAGEEKSAEALFKSAIESQPQFVKAWFSLGNLLQVRGQLPEAAQCYQRILELGLETAAVRNNLGDIRRKQGQWEAAIAEYQKALELDPHCTEADLSLGNVLYEVDRLPLEKYANYGALNCEAGWARQKAGDSIAAIECYQKAIALAPDLAIAHYRLGNILAIQNRLEEALSCYGKVLELRDSKSEESEQVGVCPRLASIRANSIQRQLDKAKKPDRLKIAFICQPAVMTIFPNPTDSLGILTYELARLLVRDCDVTVYVPGRDFREERHEEVLFRYIPIAEDRAIEEAMEVTIEETANESPDIPLVASSQYFLSYISRIARQLKIDRIDIAHVWTFSQFATILKSIEPNLKTVLHLGDELLLKLDKSLVEKRLKNIDLTIACSDYITEKLKRKFSKVSSQFQTIYNGANVDRFIQLSSLKTPKNVNNNRKRLLFIGRVSPEKGSHILLEAFGKVLDRYPEIELHLVGPTGVIPREFGIGVSDDPTVMKLEKFHREGAWSAYLKEYLSQLKKQWGEKIQQQIFFPGLLRQLQLVDYYHASDIFLFPSVWHEPFGMPIVEAMVAGVPVIATWGGAFPELIEDGKTGLLVERGNIDALAGAISRLLEDDQLRKSIARTARDRALDRFSFETVTDDLLYQYQQLGKRPKIDFAQPESIALI
ncbi:glycosyltransferase [Oscillatoriales cyanobacterium LEGE 11467]|uniref:Glycosyltransferase n=1 Tax=Zarconia navalis LEGE 11467 TaxID=1828826 RepID=A0A928VWY8_9CYAN|nr:glycosyltransferase [Zarconia navalis]MBE9041757.1 glycosyltransferase [Zarconia navalis LEGE 11467]